MNTIYGGLNNFKYP